MDGFVGHHPGPGDFIFAGSRLKRNRKAIRAAID